MFRGQNHDQKSRNIKNTACTWLLFFFFSRAWGSRELLPASLWYESGTQQTLFHETCLDELSFFGWSLLGGSSFSEVLTPSRHLVWVCTPALFLMFLLTSSSVSRRVSSAHRQQLQERERDIHIYICGERVRHATERGETHEGHTQKSETNKRIWREDAARNRRSVQG